jgi:glycerol-3-phosphate dehydrogenase (NAD(P)+)
MTSVGVMGGGPWGAALARAARRARNEVVLCSRRQDPNQAAGITVTSDMAALADTAIVIVAVPSNLARSVARDLGNHLTGRHLVVHGIRGLSGDELTTISQIVREETPVRRLGALGGPVQAHELYEGRPSALVVGSEFSDVCAALRETFHGPWLRVETTPDLVGLEWASALVGCLSIGIGYVQARADVSPGLLAALISRAVDEAAAIAVAAGASKATLYGLGGYGDLLASMALRDRPEVVLGRELASGATLAEAQERARLRVEAIELVPRIARFGQKNGVSCAIFGSLADVLAGAKSPEAVIRALFA